MNQSYPNAAGGLKMLFLAQILSIVNVVLAVVAAGMVAAALLTGDLGGASFMLIPVLLVSIAVCVLQILCLLKASNDDAGYRTPLYAAAGTLVIAVLSYFLGNVPIVGTLLTIVNTVLGFLIVNGVCQTTGNLLHSVGNEALVDRGNTVSKIYFICTIINVVCTIIGIIPIINILSGLVNAVASIVLLVGYVMYFTFLSSGSNALA